MKTRIYRSKKYPKRVKRGQGTKRTRRIRSKNRKTLRRQVTRRHTRRTRKKKRTQTGGFGAIKAAGAAAMGAAAGAAVLGVGGAAALSTVAGAAVGLGIGQGKCVCRGCLGCGQREQKVTYQCRSYNHAGYHGENGGWIQTPNGLLCGLCKGTPIGHKMMIGAILCDFFSDVDTTGSSTGSSTDCGSGGKPPCRRTTRRRMKLLRGGAVQPICTKEDYLSIRPCSDSSRCCLTCSDNLHTESNERHVNDCYGCRPAGHAGDPLCSAHDMAMKYGLSPTVSVPEGQARLGRIDRFDKVREDYDEIRRVMIAQEERPGQVDKSITFSELDAPALKAAESVSEVLSSFGMASGIEGLDADVATNIYKLCVSTLISPPNAGPVALLDFLLKVYESMEQQIIRDRDRGEQTDSRLIRYRDKFRDLLYRKGSSHIVGDQAPGGAAI
jgi:hypothetical protein